MFSVETYLSPVETHCMNVDYFFLDTDNQTHEFSEDAMTRLREFVFTVIFYTSEMFLKCLHIFLDMGRATIALFIVSFFVMFIAFWTGVAGCWRRSPGNITATAILVLLACTFLFYSCHCKICKKLYFMINYQAYSVLVQWDSGTVWNTTKRNVLSEMSFSSNGVM